GRRSDSAVIQTGTRARSRDGSSHRDRRKGFGSFRNVFIVCYTRLTMDDLKKMIREVPDFPKKGILFYDITTLLKDRTGFRNTIDALTDQIRPMKPDAVLGIEARGFIFAPALAYNLGAGFVPVRKPNKLPAATERISYELEYGMDTLEMHKDAVQPGMRVVIADDLL